MINRHNYEEFFLLYADNELDADGRAVVEEFVRQNSDLGAELELLQQTILIDNNIIFNQKEALYKQENSISLANYEEYFLLAADNELTKQQDAEVEHFVLKHPQLQNEFTLLQQTKLKAVQVAFAWKKKLYRKEQKVRKIIPFALVRMGAAAAIAGAVYISFILFIDKESHNINTAQIIVLAPEKKAEIPHNQSIQKPETEKSVALQRTKKEIGNDNKDKTFIRKREKIIIVKPQKQVAEEAIALQKPANKTKESFVHPDSNILQKNIHKTENTVFLKNKKDLDNSIKKDSPYTDLKNALAVNEPVVKENKSLFAHAVYLETENADQEKSLYIGSAKINKNKLKGFFKKATVFLDKKILRGDNDN